MRNVLLFLILTLYAGCSKKEVTEIVAKPKMISTQISLRLIGYDKSFHKGFIDLTIENKILPIAAQLEISDSGMVYFNFLNDRKREIMFRYVDINFNMILSPGENLVAEVKVEELLSHDLKTVRTQGENSKTNKLILSHMDYFGKQFLEDQEFYRKNHASNEDYKKGRLELMKTHLKSFNILLKQSKIEDEAFRKWGTWKIKNAAGSDVAAYQHPNEFGQRDPEDNYFDFTEDLVSDEPIMYFSRLEYLKMLKDGIEIALNNSKNHKREKDRLKKTSHLEYIFFPLLLEHLKDLPEGSDREIMIAYAFQGKPKTIDAYQDELDQLVSPDLAALLKGPKRELSTEPIQQLLSKYNISKKERDELLSLYTDTQGKVVFHDFWSKGCAPCLQEFAHYNNFIDQAGQDVAFIFLATDLSEADWQATIKKYKLKGRHVLLTANQFAFYQEHFRVRHYPWHSLIDGRGRLSTDKIPHVLPQNFSRINGQIGKVKAKRLCQN